MDRIDQQGAALFDDLLSYALRYTDTTEAELTRMWESAMSAAQRYGSFVNALNGVRAEIDVTENGANAAESSKELIVSEMKSNSSKWHGASPEEQARLESRNEYLGAQISGAYRDNNGVWWIGNEELYKKYHSGTPSVGMAPTPKQNEVFALLEKGEQVINQKQQNGLAAFLAPYMKKVALPSYVTSMASFLTGMTDRPSSPNVNVDASINVHGAIDEQVLKVIKDHPREVAEQVSRVICPA